MLRTVLGISLLVLYLSFLIRPVVPYIQYRLQQEQIAETKCENKDNVKLECHGKCFLAKKLKEVFTDESSASENTKPLHNPTKNADDKEIFHKPVINCCTKKYYGFALKNSYIQTNEHTVICRSHDPLTPPPKV